MTNKLPIWFLRLGLGAMYAYSGYDLITTPSHWQLFVPKWLAEMLGSVGMPIETFLRLQGAVELAMVFVFLAWFLPRSVVFWAATVSAVELSAILVFFGVDLITFRDLGLVGASAALAVLSRSRQT